MIYNKHNYINKNVLSIRDVYIREYDIKSAGLNIIYHKNYITEKEYNILKNMDKTKRNVTIGKWLRSNKEVNKVMMDEFIEIRRKFFEANEIQDDEVLSIKKDAIFLVNKEVFNLDIDGYIFIKKHEYTDYFRIDNKEFYYDKYNDKLDIKGLPEESKNENNPLIKVTKELFKLGKNKDNIFRLLIELKTNYLEFKLDKEYYKDLLTNTYNFDICGNLRSLDEIPDDLKQYADINNNLAFINELIRVFI